MLDTINKPDIEKTTEVAEWVAKTRNANGESVGAIVQLGQTLIDAKDALNKHGQWLPMIDNELRYNRSYVERLMQVARDPRLSNTANWPNLPPVLSTLVALTRLSDTEFEQRKADGTIHQEMTRKQIAGFIEKPTKTKSVPPRQALLEEFQTYIEDLKKSMKAGDITVDDIQWAIGELTALLA